VATVSRKFALARLPLAALLFAAACDPNVVIGEKWRTNGVGGSGDTGGVPPVSGSGGTSGVSGDSAAVIAGDAGAPAGAAPDAGAAGMPSGLIFFADQDDGTHSLQQWDEPAADVDAGGYYADPGAPLPQYSAGPAHSGDGSAKVTIDTSGGDQIARLYRRIGNDDAYYIAWFYLNEDHTQNGGPPGAWWSIFLFRAVKDRNASIDLWSVDLVRSPTNTLTVALFDHQFDNGNGKPKGRTISVATQPPPLVPIAQWFQIQAHLHAAWGTPSQLTLWLDGVQVFKLDDTTPAPDQQPLYWVIGNGGSKMSPPKSTIFIDDAQITTSFVRP
jgi:hypothetical protein